MVRVASEVVVYAYQLADCLNIDALTHIIVDFTYQDPKQRNIFDIPETRQELFRRVFAHDRLKAGLQAGKIKLVMF
jgi:protein CMS1